ncbi:MAG: hypothetical protein AAGD25_40975 [Cyanobacteria bacterium P01_F01_bin.150]
MKPSFLTATTTRNLGLSLGIGLSLGAGLLGLTAYSSSQASSSTTHASAPILRPSASLSHSQANKQVVPASSASAQSPGLMEASTVANPELEQALNQLLPELATCPDRQAALQETAKETNPNPRAHRYAYHAVDLNGDRQDELIVQVMGPMTCGTGGCTTFVLQESSNSRLSDHENTSAYDVVTRMSLVNFPVIVSDRTSAGWNNLLVMVVGGGAQPGYRQMQFDGQSYPTNPSVEQMVTVNPEQPNGKVLTLSEEVGAIAPVIQAEDCES